MLVISSNLAHANECHRAILSTNTSIIPKTLLIAIGKRESGLNPYAVNAGGESKIFSTKEEAIEFVKEKVINGKTNIDIGCMQINFKYHAHNFNSLEEMFSAKSNVNYSKNFLEQLVKEKGNIANAVAHYHSSNPAHQLKYLQYIVSIWTKDLQAPKHNTRQGKV